MSNRSGRRAHQVLVRHKRWVFDAARAAERQRVLAQGDDVVGETGDLELWVDALDGAGCDEPFGTPFGTYDRAVPDVRAPRLVAVLGVGAIPDPDAAVLHADDVGLTRGDGCFEAVRVVTGSDGDTVIEDLDAHLERFARSAAGLEIPCDVDAWRALIADAVVVWAHPGVAMLRIMLTRGRESSPTGPPTGLLMIAPLPAAAVAGRDGVSVVTLNSGRTADAWTDLPWLLGGIKTLSYAINVAAAREAHRRGADDALFVSTDGFALEGARSALVWRHGDHLATTRHDGTGVLASTVQATVFEQAAAEGIGVSYELIIADDLVRTDGAWLLSSGRLVAPILTLDGAALAHDREWTDRMGRWAGMYET